MSAIEFSRLLRADKASEAPQPLDLNATADECAALAKRFGLIALDRLEANLNWHRVAGGWQVEGRLRADVVQACVASGLPVPVALNTPFRFRFEREDQANPNEEIELDTDDCDVLPFDGQSADVGEAVAQELALSLDPFPRAPDADVVLKAAGVKSEDEAGAFGALAGLRDQLSRGGSE